MRHQLAVVSLVLLAFAATLALHIPWAGAAAHDVTVTDFSFTDTASSNSTTTITAGETVTWNWSGGDIHSVTADDGSFDSDPPSSWRASGSFQQTFNTPGSYAYYCRVHGGPGGQGMAGTVVVQAAAPTSTPTPPAAPSDTPEPTSTPRTPSATPEATDTPDPAATAAPIAPPPEAAVDAPVVPATEPVAVTGAAVRLPSTGFGPDEVRSPVWPAILIVIVTFSFVCAAATQICNRHP